MFGNRDGKYGDDRGLLWNGEKPGDEVGVGRFFLGCGVRRPDEGNWRAKAGGKGVDEGQGGGDFEGGAADGGRTHKPLIHRPWWGMENMMRSKA